MDHYSSSRRVIGRILTVFIVNERLGHFLETQIYGQVRGPVLKTPGIGAIGGGPKFSEAVTDLWLQ